MDQFDAYFDAYRRLGLRPDCSLEDVKQAFSEKITDCHPEEHPKEYQELLQAYQLLKKLKKDHKDSEEDVWESQPDKESQDDGQPEDSADDSAEENPEETDLKDEIRKLDEEFSQEEKERLEKEEKEKRQKQEEEAKWAVWRMRLAQAPGWSALSPGKRSAEFLYLGLVSIGIEKGEPAGIFDNFDKDVPKEFAFAALNVFAQLALETLEQMEPCPKRTCRKIRKEFLKACFRNRRGFMMRPLNFGKENEACQALLKFLNQKLEIHPPGEGAMKPIDIGAAILLFFCMMFVPLGIAASCGNVVMLMVLFFLVTGGTVTALYWRMRWNSGRWSMLARLGYVSMMMTAYFFMDTDTEALPRILGLSSDILQGILYLVEYAAMMIGIGAFLLQRAQEHRS